MMIRADAKLMNNFQERISEVIDEFLLLGADPDRLREILLEEITSDLAARAKELGAAS